jgi:hypothetical protein
MLDLPVPLQILEDYREQHSVESLSHSPGCRKYLLAHYRCPVSAGNRMHEFMNSYFWAVLLNRTLLYTYLDEDLCLRLQKMFKFVNEDAQCSVNNTIQDCARILDRAPWIPSYEEWQTRLGLPNPHFMSVNDFGPHSLHLNSLTGIDVAYNAVPVLAVRPLSRRFDTFAITPKTRAFKLKRKATLDRVEALFSMGHRFLFGALFRSSFDFRPEFRAPQTNVSTDLTNEKENTVNPFSMAIHSRHVRLDDDGCDIKL